MTVDKRFWTSAVVVVTVVTAGASTLPALLLTPADPPPLATAAVAAKPAEPKPPEPLRNVVPGSPAEAAPARSEPQGQAEPEPSSAPPVQTAAAAPPPGAAEPAVASPQPAPAAPQPPPAAQPAPPAPPAAAVSPPAGAVSFPPVQPIGVAATRTENAPAIVPAPETSRTAGATAKPARHVRVGETRAAPPARKRIRPAAYPIREFLAWRR